MQSHFTDELFEFLLELRANNNREWFNANKGRYERHLKEPLLAFIEDFEPYLHSISEHFVADARANGGSMFRIYRDVRFSKDKTPYKTQAAVQFRHEAGKSVHAPGFYLHLAPGEVFAGVGLWRPDSAALGRIRERIVADPAGWDAAVGDPGFVEEFDLDGDSLKRPPRGFDPEHPRIEDLKRKDHVATCYFDEEEVTQPGFIDSFADACRTASPYMEFLTQAVGLPYRGSQLVRQERRRIIGAQLASAPLDADEEAVLDASAEDVAGASGVTSGTPPPATAVAPMRYNEVTLSGMGRCTETSADGPSSFRSGNCSILMTCRGRSLASHEAQSRWPWDGSAAATIRP